MVSRVAADCIWQQEMLKLYNSRMVKVEESMHQGQMTEKKVDKEDDVKKFCHRESLLCSRTKHGG